MNNLVQNYIGGDSAVKIAQSIENAIREGKLPGGERLPAVRALAEALVVSPATVSAAYRSLQARGLLVAQGRRGTKVSHLPIHRWRCAAHTRADGRNLCDGNPDPELLPALAPIINRIDPTSCLYGVPTANEDLVELVAREFTASGVCKGEMCVVNGAMDGIERVMAEHLRPGDRVAVEDPGFGNTFDLVISRGLSLLPVAVDGEGIMPDRLEQSCRRGAKALIVTPRAQNPTGAAYSEDRARQLRRVLRRWPELLVIEDDHGSMITDVSLHCLHDSSRRRWAYVRSASKALGPDLRLAVLTGDSGTTSRVLDRMLVGGRWVSHILQRIVCTMLGDQRVRDHLQSATRQYAQRRRALVEALSAHGIDVVGCSGFNVWIPVAEETPIVQALAEAGWSVSAGERFRIESSPAIRITTATLQPEEAPRLAADLARALARPSATATV